MTLAEFIDKLEADGGWWLDQWDHIRRRDNACCPLEHVAGLPHWSWSSQLARRRLRMTTYVGQQIVSAADEKAATIRARLLKACGLEEAA